MGYATFTYENGAVTDLDTLIDPSSGWTLSKATAINDNGLIVGDGDNAETGRGARSCSRRFRATPEPSTLVLLCAGAFALIGYGWRRSGHSRCAEREPVAGPARGTHRTETRVPLRKGFT